MKEKYFTFILVNIVYGFLFIQCESNSSTNSYALKLNKECPIKMDANFRACLNFIQ